MFANVSVWCSLRLARSSLEGEVMLARESCRLYSGMWRGSDMSSRADPGVLAILTSLSYLRETLRVA